MWSTVTPMRSACLAGMPTWMVRPPVSMTSCSDCGRPNRVWTTPNATALTLTRKRPGLFREHAHEPEHPGLGRGVVPRAGQPPLTRER